MGNSTLNVGNPINPKALNPSGVAGVRVPHCNCAPGAGPRSTLLGPKRPELFGIRVSGLGLSSGVLGV